VSLFLGRIRNRWPQISADHARQLASVWERHLDSIIERVHALTKDSGRVAWHVSAREEAIGEMAHLLALLSRKVFEDRSAGRAIEAIDPVEEVAALGAPDELARVENTAKVVAEQIWFPVYDRLAAKYPLVEQGSDSRLPRSIRGHHARQRQPGTKRNHYIPSFTVRPWADAADAVRVFMRGRGGAVAVRTRSIGAFGYEKFLYSQPLENWFGGVEQAAARTYSKLVTVDALTSEDRYWWIVFLSVQVMRTPYFMSALAGQLKRRAAAEGWPWVLTPALLRAAHAQLFSDDRVFAGYYRRFASRRWSILTAASGLAFPRTDAPVVPVASNERHEWHCYYPLTPSQCFLCGPSRVDERDVPAALPRTVSPEATEELVELLVSSSRRSFVTRVGDPEARWLAVVQKVPRHNPTEMYRAWGAIDS
jgi:hypothetical protein